MTPQVKAKGLVEKFYSEIMVFRTAKQCALIAVDEMIKELEQLRKPEYTTFIIEYGEPGITMDGYEKIIYCQEVKEEIQKL